MSINMPFNVSPRSHRLPTEKAGKRPQMLPEVSVPFTWCAERFDTDFSNGVPASPRAAESVAYDKLSFPQLSDGLLPEHLFRGAVSLSGGGTEIVLIGAKRPALRGVGRGRHLPSHQSELLGRWKQDGLAVMGRLLALRSPNRDLRSIG